jgi:DNA repair protein RadC
MKQTTNVSDTSGLSLSRKAVQLTLQFDASTEPFDTESSPQHRATSSLKVNQEKYASVKKVSLVFEGSLQGRPCLTSTQDALAFFKSYWSTYPASDQEKFVVACLDTKHRVQCVVVVTVGTLDASLVHPREVFKPAFIEGSSAVILSHNHPSGTTTPSREDHQVTKRLTEAGAILGIQVLDHIIYGDGTGDVVSLREVS